MPGSDARPLPVQDLEHILEHTEALWQDLRGARLFVTGGTAFFGRWMLESFLKANDDLGLGAEATVLTRDPARFAAAAPHVAEHAAVTLHRGDVKSFEFPTSDCSHVLHMATEAGPGMSQRASFQTATAGTERVLAYAALRGSHKLLLTSSGAVYGKQPPDCDRLSEEYAGAPQPEDANAGYSFGKRAAESLCLAVAAESGVEVKIARCFAFVGPLLPLDQDYAIGNFFGDALDRDHIEIKGDGTARRSYLYASDLAIWLWTILVRGESGRPYNVGSEQDLSIAELAGKVAGAVRPGIPVRIAQTPTGAAPSRYIPSTARAKGELGLQAHVMLDEAVRRTAQWHRDGPAPAGAG
ncbi:MAG: NAD-dependent epimerase/dehydratase family protein [Chloroflexi bacterium]|nr:NAD-dependent epimerase/dehydratase family protein [Chloroflexota bacterium]